MPVEPALGGSLGAQGGLGGGEIVALVIGEAVHLAIEPAVGRNGDGHVPGGQRFQLAGRRRADGRAGGLRRGCSAGRAGRP
jgi:hypothetical protein